MSEILPNAFGRFRSKSRGGDGRRVVKLNFNRYNSWEQSFVQLRPFTTAQGQGFSTLFLSVMEGQAPSATFPPLHENIRQVIGALTKVRKFCSHLPSQASLVFEDLNAIRVAASEQGSEYKYHT